LEFGSSWAAVRGSDGAIYLGGGHGGAVYVAVGKKVTKLASLKGAVAVVSLQIVGADLYAGTMPGGEVWKVSTKIGASPQRVVALEKAETVWSLALARDGKHLYAGTGPEGKLFKIDLGAKRAEVVFEADDKRITALCAARDGSIWLGTSDKALLYRHDPSKGTTRAMADFSGNEVTALAEYQGNILAAANELKEPSTSGFKTKRAVDEAEKEDADTGEKIQENKNKPGSDKATPAAAEAPRKGGRTGKGAIFLVRGDGQLRQLHSLNSTYFTSLVVTADGQIFAGAADKGRIYLIGADESVSTAFDVEERRIDQIVYQGVHGLAFTTSDGGAIYCSAGLAKKATYTSKVLDAAAPSRFGRLVWWGEGALNVESRSGNTSEPGKGWSEWQRPKEIQKGGGGSAHGEVVSPPGRYFQYRVRFKSRNELLRHTALYYLPQNRPTRVTEITVAPEEESRKSLTTMKTGATKPRSPVVKVSWKVENEDGDETVYSLAVRRQDEVAWRPIVTGDKPLTSTEFAWNTETFPDGYYRLRVVASDARANTHDRAREHQMITPLFLIDNEKPVVSGLTVKYPMATARATDSFSAIAEMAYSVDDGDWQVGETQDGLFDSPVENLVIRLPTGLTPGAHTLSVRVADEAGNIGAATATFRVR
jgi:hypothetical protein